ncbi:MAG TPA: 4Fe-4S binding protein [Candidatus Limnocylindria bacterium]|nr:4Fe-4S binding protein [Candidatus Limnocylindria bacterium]
MLRQVIKIDSGLCNGCGLCAQACHEGAIEMRDGKAVLTRDDYCDGLGNCLPACPTGAITFETREAAPFDAEAVKARMEAARAHDAQGQEAPPQDGFRAMPSHLGSWPVQIRLVNPQAAFLRGASLLIAADCAAYAHGDFHRRFMQGRVALIGCPKLDDVDYSDKLAAILRDNDIRDVTLVRMEVPCCGGLEYALKQAIRKSGRDVPLAAVTLSVRGEILSQ